jgi:hypothetical protein
MKSFPKIWLAIGLVLIGIIGGGVWWLQTNSKPISEIAPVAKKKLSLPLNVIPESDRPFVSVEPVADGRNVIIKVTQLKKIATEAEYELEYQAGSLLQGAFGTIKLDKIPSETKLLLGSCSAGGACTYHTDVQGGSLLMRYTGPESFALKTDWKYIENKTKETAFSSKDGKFQVSAPALAKEKLMIISNSPGYPADPKAPVVSEHYNLALATPVTGKLKLSIRAREEGKLTIQGWNGQSWVSFPTTIAKDDTKMAEAEVEPMALYLVTK